MPITRFQTPAMIVMQPRIWMLPMTIQRMAEVLVSSRISRAIASAGVLGGWGAEKSCSCPCLFPQTGQNWAPSGISFPQFAHNIGIFPFLNEKSEVQTKVGARNEKSGKFRRTPKASTAARISQSGPAGTRRETRSSPYFTKLRASARK